MTGISIRHMVSSGKELTHRMQGQAAQIWSRPVITAAMWAMTAAGITVAANTGGSVLGTGAAVGAIFCAISGSEWIKDHREYKKSSYRPSTLDEITRRDGDRISTAAGLGGFLLALYFIQKSHTDLDVAITAAGATMASLGALVLKTRHNSIDGPSP
jgi:hypothetical protein